MWAMYRDAVAVVLIAVVRLVEYFFVFIVRLRAIPAGGGKLTMTDKPPPVGNLQREANPVARWLYYLRNCTFDPRHLGDRFPHFIMTRESGHFSFPLEFEDWSVSKETLLGEIRRHELHCRLTQFEDGRIAFTLSDPKGEVFTIRTQKIQVDKPGAVLLMANWTANEKCIYANGKKLLPADQTEETVVIKASPRSRIVDGPISFQQPEAKEACRKWIEWRAAYLGNPPAQAEPGRRLKSFLEQVGELERSQLLLRELISRAESGANHVVGAIATELRALVYWPKNQNRNYDPLLLRLAARRNAPLPVWAFVVRGYSDKALEDLANVSKSMESLALIHLPDIKKSETGQKLIDLQAWLDDPFQLNAEGAGTKEYGKICVTNKELIKQISSIIGTSHYDEDIPVELDAFRNFFGESGGEMNRMVVHVSKTVHDLISYFRAEYLLTTGTYSN
jgi:hypothetical protein